MRLWTNMLAYLSQTVAADHYCVFSCFLTCVLQVWRVSGLQRAGVAGVGDQPTHGRGTWSSTNHG
jgi:hypothetical protein